MSNPSLLGAKWRMSPPPQGAIFFLGFYLYIKRATKKVSSILVFLANNKSIFCNTFNINTFESKHGTKTYVMQIITRWIIINQNPTHEFAFSQNTRAEVLKSVEHVSIQYDSRHCAVAGVETDLRCRSDHEFRGENRENNNRANNKHNGRYKGAIRRYY